MDDPTRPSLDAFATAGHAFSIPWSNQVRPLLTTLNSSLLTESRGPWMIASPFDYDDIKLSTLLADSDGGRATFRDELSTTSGSESEHLSASLGVTVGYPFLNASVTGQYDKSQLENRSSVRASRNASCRLGRVIPEGTPALSTEALDLLGRQDGRKRFLELYGDFYVCGYELGADAGASLLAYAQSSTEEERLALTVTVKAPFVEESATSIDNSSSSSASASMVFDGYSTISNENTSLKTYSTDAEERVRIQLAASGFLKRVGAMDHEARESLKRLGLHDGKSLDLSHCTHICQSGLVVQLLLAPLARLNEFVAACR